MSLIDLLVHQDYHVGLLSENLPAKFYSIVLENKIGVECLFIENSDKKIVQVIQELYYPILHDIRKVIKQIDGIVSEYLTKVSEA